MYFNLLSVVLSVQYILALDNLELLGETLRSFHRVSCDGQTITLNCPPGTCISVQMAQYLTTAPSACTRDSMSDINSTCLWASTIQTVVEACQKKRQCELLSTSNPYVTSLCPHRRKFVQVYYKCRPYEFRSKTACQNEVLQMSCSPNTRVAVYSASFGRIEYENVQCHQPQGVREETCLVRYATETVMQICHGKRYCNLSANVDTFGDPCQPQSRLYLKVVYTCVPRAVLQDNYVSRLQEDELLNSLYYTEVPDRDENTFRQETFTESSNLAVAGRSYNSSNLVTSTSSWPSTVSSRNKSFSDTKEDKIVIALIGVVFLTLLVTVIILLMAYVRCYYVRSPSRHSDVKVVNDEVTEGDIGVDLTAITPSSAITMLSSPTYCSSIEITGFESNPAVHDAPNRTISLGQCYSVH